jgi:hypothetical protein
MIRATLAAPPGTPAQASGIGVFLPRQENLTGIVAPAANAGLRTVIVATLDGVAGPAAVLAAGPDPVDPPPDPPQAAGSRAASAVNAPTAARLRLNEH